MYQNWPKPSLPFVALFPATKSGSGEGGRVPPPSSSCGRPPFYHIPAPHRRRPRLRRCRGPAAPRVPVPTGLAGTRRSARPASDIGSYPLPGAEGSMDPHATRASERGPGPSPSVAGAPIDLVPEAGPRPPPSPTPQLHCHGSTLTHRRRRRGRDAKGQQQRL